ncbi:MAG: class I SAM-dependent methyltransferase [Proteobacteria bacterium]|nr:class I SAM-dependent methyltransferase [Pseudomonadota bacterium]
MNATSDRPIVRSPSVERGASPLLRALLAILARLQCGSLQVEMPDGRVYRAAGPEPGPEGRIAVASPKFLRRLFREGHLGFGEMFVDGWWTTPDLQSLLDVIMLNNDGVGLSFPGAGLFRLWERLRRRLKANTRTGSRRNIAYHYDLGNDFYALWLDETMTYSSALFRSPKERLADAQRNKYAAICDRIAQAPGGRVLEIGCGWGGFAEYAIRERGLRVTGLTLSREQRDYARKRLFQAGLADRADIVLRDYREERGAYDAVASIEMIEAVGEKYWPVFFSTLRERLRPGGVAALQAITISDWLFPQYRNSTDFIQRYIFPGGLLPSPEKLRDCASGAGLQTIGVDSYANSYTRTLNAWRRRFNARWNRIAELGFDDRFHRMWNFYLAASAAGFVSGTTDVVQIAYRKQE